MLLLASSAGYAAPPDVTAFFPAGGGLGETPEVTITGTFNNWPVKFWCSNEKLKVDCGSSKGKLVIHIPADAPCGIAWIRLIDAEGASTPRPFIIAAQPSVREKDPNDSPKQAQKVSLPAVVHGKFDKNGDSDSYAVELQEGQTLVASLQSNEVLGSPADPALQICDAAGQVLAMNQDAVGLDPLVMFRAKATGTYLVRTFALPATPNSSINFAGGELFIYRLTLTTGPFADYAMPLAASRSGETALTLHGSNVPSEKVLLAATAGFTEQFNWTPPAAAGLIPLRYVDVPLVVARPEVAKDGQAIETPCCISGCVSQPHEVHRFTFDGKKGTKLAIAAESAGIGFEMDPFIKLTGPDGKTVAEADDKAKNQDPEMNATLAADGRYALEIRDTFHSGGPRHVYRLLIEAPRPRLTLSVTAGNFIVEAGKMVEIPVTINRQNGFSDEVTITAVDLPAGVSVVFATSQNKGDTAKQVKLVLTATPEAQAGPIRIVALAGGAEDQNKDENDAATIKPPLTEAAYSQTLGGSTFQHSAIWLGVKEAK